MAMQLCSVLYSPRLLPPPALFSPAQTSSPPNCVGYCGGVEAMPRSGGRPAVAETEMTSDAVSDELTEWQEGVGWIY